MSAALISEIIEAWRSATPEARAEVLATLREQAARKGGEDQNAGASS